MNESQRFYKEVRSIIEEKSYFREAFKSRIVDINPIITTEEEAFRSLQELIDILRECDDNHSHFTVDYEKTTRENQPVEVSRVEDVIYIDMPTHICRDDESLVVNYAQELQDQVRELYSPEIRGFILDMRRNSGGNMYPMILGLGFLSNRDDMATFEFPDGYSHNWGYKDGCMYYCEEEIYRLDNPFELDKRDLPLKIIIGGKTSSSGEITTIALMGKNTQTIGDLTTMHTTANAVYSFDNGSILALATSNTFDWQGNSYEKGIKPDLQLEEGQDALEVALAMFKE